MRTTQIKVLILIGFLAAAIFSLMAYYVLNVERNHVYRQFAHDARSLLSHKKDKIAIRLKALERDLIFLSSVPPIQGIPRAVHNGGYDSIDETPLALWQGRLKIIFQEWISAFPDILQVSYQQINKNDHELVRVTAPAHSLIADGGAIKIKNQAKYLDLAAQLGNGEVSISINALDNDGLETAQDIVWVEMATMPIYHHSDRSDSEVGESPLQRELSNSSLLKLFGMIVIHLKSDALLSQLDEEGTDQYNFILFNQTGDALLKTPNKFSRQVSLDNMIEIVSEFEFQSLGTLDAARLYRFIDRQVTFIAKQMPLKGDFNKNWPQLNLVIAVEQTQLEQAAYKRLWRVMLIVFAGVTVVWLMFYLLWRNAVREQKATIEQARLASIVSASQDAIVGINREGIITDWNQAAERIFQYSAQDAIGRAIIKLIVPLNNQAEEVARMASVFAGEECGYYIAQRRAKTGQCISVSIALSPLKDNQKKVAGIAMTFRDVTQQLENEEQIKLLNASLEQQVEQRTVQIKSYHALQQAILNHAGNAIITTDTDGIITLFNPAAEKMLGYSAIELVGKQSPAIFHLESEVVERARAFSNELNIELQPGFEVFVCKSRLNLSNRHEWIYVDKAGRQFPVSLSITALKNEQGDIYGFLGMASDISNEVQSRRRLESLRDQLVKAAEIAELGIWSWDLATDKLVWNQQMYQIFQIPADELAEGVTYQHWHDSVHPDDVKPTVAKLEAALAGTATFNPTFRIIRHDGEIRYVLAGAIVERDEKGNPLYVVGINRDVTEQHQYQHHLERAKLEADKASQAKSEFLANMSHEIRTPMNAVFGMIQLLKQTELSNSQRNYIQKTEASAKALLGVINDILDFSKIEAGKLELDLHPCNLEQLLTNIGSIIASVVGNKEIEIVFDIDPEIQKSLTIDETRLQQILVNLGSNAVKFTDKGQVALRVRQTPIDAHRVKLDFSMSDTGIGISSQHLATIFDGFSQAESSTTRRFGGTGLGLSISQKLVAMMGGQLTVDSELGKGSCFSFSIECPVGDFIAKEPASYLNRLSVLVVDDNDTAREVMQSICESLGWQVTTAKTGAEAVEIVSSALPKQAFQVILMDWRMPDMDGLDASEKIKQLFSKNEGPVIIMVSAYSREILLGQRPMQMSLINDYLVKPITASTLVDCIASNMDEGELKTGLTPQQQRLAGMSILLVEDNATNQEIARDLLQNEGAVIQIAENGEQALTALINNEQKFDVVLMDIQMPLMDGYQATREIRQHLGLDDLPIIAMTANAFAKDRKAALEAGMNDHVGKPFDIDQLIGKILALTKLPQIQKTAKDHRGVTPKIAGDFEVLNIADALKRFKNKTELYHRTLKLFLTDLPKRIAEIPDFLTDTNHENTVFALHSIKGSAATLGAEALSEISSHLEELLKNKTTSDIDEKAYLSDLVQFKYLALATAQQMEKVLGSKGISLTQEITPAQKQQLATKLTELGALLSQANLKALNMHKEIFDDYASMLPEHFKTLDDSVNQMDFAGAAKLCEQIREQLESH